MRKKPGQAALRQPSRAPGTYDGKVREALRIERSPATDGSSRSTLWRAERIDVSKKNPARIHPGAPRNPGGPSRAGLVHHVNWHERYRHVPTMASRILAQTIRRTRPLRTHKADVMEFANYHPG